MYHLATKESGEKKCSWSQRTKHGGICLPQRTNHGGIYLPFYFVYIETPFRKIKFLQHTLNMFSII